MRKIFTLQLFLALLFLAEITNATNYYLSATGNDANNGTSPATAWRTLSKLNSSFGSINAGDTIFLNRGDVFAGTVRPTKDGTSGNKIVWAAYGTGAQPEITGFATLTGWTSLGGNKYEKVISGQPAFMNMVIMDGAFQKMGRYPKVTAAENGWVTLQSHSGLTSITSNAISGFPNFVGGEVVIRKLHWIIDRNRVLSQTSNTVGIRSFPAPAGQGTYGITNGYGFFFQNHVNTLSEHGEWAYDSTSKKITMFLSTDPSNYTIKVSNVDILMDMTSDDHHKFTNITFSGSNQAGIYMSGTTNIIFESCSFNFHGYNGIKVQSSDCSNISLINCTSDYSNSTFLDAYSSPNWTITGCDFRHAGIVRGMSGNGDSQADLMAYVGSGTTIRLNTFKYFGYNGIFFVGNNVLIEKNYMDSACMTRDDGAHIYTYGATVYSNRVVQDNLLLHSIGDTYGVGADNQNSAYGLYADGGANNINYLRNTVAYSGGANFHANSLEVSTIRDNIFYSAGDAEVNWNSIAGGGPTRNINMKKNIFFATDASKYIGKYYNGPDDYSQWGVIDSNFLCRPSWEPNSINTGGYQIAYVHDGGIMEIRESANGYRYYSLDAHVIKTTWDANSQKSPAWVTTTNDSLFVNPTNATVNISSSRKWKDLYGTEYNGIVSLTAYKGKLLFDIGAATGGSNQPPTANAGTDKNITLPISSITQTGSGTDPDGTIAAYQWTKIAGPAQFTIVSPTQAQTVINNLAQGVYQFELRVTDNLGATATDIMTITVNPVAVNQAPTANAGTNKNITLPTSSITQTGSGTDPDGTISAYQWTKIAGPAQFTIVSATQAQTVINNLAQGVYQFELRVVDNLGATDTDTMQVTVNAAANQPPLANAGTDKNITLPTSSITQTGSGTDPDGTIAAYQWTKIAGPAQFTIVSPAQAQTVINNLAQGVYQFELRVVDNLGAADTDTMTVTVNPAAVNQAPTANAGTNKNITLPTSSITQTGSGTDPDGTIAAYQWTKISGPAQYVIVSQTQAQTVINNLGQGVYQFELRVTDNLGAIGRDTMTVTVNPAVVNQPPVANAGVNRNITLPVNSFTQTGSGTDPDGTISAYQWAKVSGPAQFTIVSPNQAQTVINNLVQGVYQFELRVTDNLGATGTDIMTVTVNAAANQPPGANAGANQTILLPVNGVTQTGSGTDPDGTITAYLWTKISGSNQFTIVSPAQSQTVINNLGQGVFQFELKVTDNLGATGRDTVTVTVNGSASRKAPKAKAGPHQSINLPINNVTLRGEGIPDSTANAVIVSYNWAKINGPSQHTIVSPNQAQTNISNLSQGVYQFELTVTDNFGDTGKDTLSVTVNGNGFQPTIANAGTDQTITLPNNSVAITGSGSTTPDRNIIAYQWAKVSGPVLYTIVSPTLPHTEFINLEKGIYRFVLSVTDNLGSIGKDTVTIEVIEEASLIAQVYPNPVIDKINIRINPPKEPGNLKIRVYDSRGIVIFEKEISAPLVTRSEEIDMTKYQNGFYIVEIITGKNQRETMKFVKQ